MAIKTDPFSGISYGEDKGADNWNIWMDTNLLNIGLLLYSAVESSTTTAPAPIVNGEAWIIPAGATGSWSTHVDEIAYAVEGAYTYIAPIKGMRKRVSDTGIILEYDGAAWIDADDFGTL